MSNTYCVVSLFCFVSSSMLPDSPDYPFLIAPSSCVLYVSSFSGLSILDYTIGII